MLNLIKSSEYPTWWGVIEFGNPKDRRNFVPGDQFAEFIQNVFES
jgi:hypothetical protein